MERFKKVGVVFVIILVIFLIIVCYDSKILTSKEKKLTKNQQNWIHDVEQIRNILEDSIGIDYRLSDKKREKKIDGIIEHIKENNPDDIDIYYELSELFSDIEIGHLTFSPSNVKSEHISIDKDGQIKRANLYPIGGMWFGDEYRIINVLEENKDIAGGILKQINGISFEKILERYDSIFVNETKGGLKNIFQKYNYNFFFREYLDRLGIAKKDKATFTVEKNGELIDVVLDSMTYDELLSSKYIYTLNETDEAAVPMWYRAYSKANGAPFYYEHDYENYAIYFQYNSCVDNTTKHLSTYNENLPNFSEFFDGMMWYMQSNQGTYSQFIIDLRHNLGGDYYLISDAIDKHMAFLQTQNIKIIIGDNYSAGHMAVEDILRISPFIKIYGEESNSSIKNYTEITNSKITLDNCKWTIYVPTKEDFRDNLKYRQTDWNIGIIPDNKVSQSYDDFLTGIDTVYYFTLLN